VVEEIISQPPRLGQPGSPALLVEPICLSDFPVGRSQRSDHLALPEISGREVLLYHHWRHHCQLLNTDRN
jgi:hypothetical protein